MTSAAPYVFNANEIWTLAIAAYAAVVSTFVLGWDAYKWLASGPRIDLSASTGMQIVGAAVRDPKTYVSVTAWNVGDQPTTITNLGGMYFGSWWRAYLIRRMPSKAFIITDPSQSQRIPYRFEVGDQWLGLVDQTDEIEQMAKDGYLFLILYTAGAGHGHRVRVKVSEKNADSS
ncbi:MAG: hypothetical protein LM517_03185 [Nitrosomonas sp.]|nr:hypothetical protein [Nitrosomonas sp.]